MEYLNNLPGKTMFLFVRDMHIIDPLGFMTGFLIFACLLLDVLPGTRAFVVGMFVVIGMFDVVGTFVVVGTFDLVGT
jgi:hypothetical protein